MSNGDAGVFQFFSRFKIGGLPPLLFLLLVVGVVFSISAIRVRDDRPLMWTFMAFAAGTLLPVIYIALRFARRNPRLLFSEDHQTRQLAIKALQGLTGPSDVARSIEAISNPAARALPPHREGDGRMKVWILTYNLTEVAQVELASYIASRQEILNWSAPHLGLILLVTHSWHDATSVSKVIRERFERLTFIVSPVTSIDVNGWMSKDIWSFIQQPSSVRNTLASLMAGLPPPKLGT